MKFSVIVPIYNVEEYLERCINSILQQTFNDFELLLVNDGSPDQCVDICKKYSGDFKVRYFEKENGGLGDARNYGIDRARGDFLVFVDSDDYIEKDMLENVNAAIDKYDSDIIIFNQAIVDMQDNLLYIDRQPLETGRVMNFQTNKQLFLIEPSACNKVFKRQLFIENQIRFPVRVWYEDLRTTNKVLAVADNVVYIDKAFYHYFKRPGSIMNNSNIKRNMEIIDAVEDLRSFFNEHFPAKYKDEMEFLAISKVIVDTTGRIMSVGYDRSVVEQLYLYVNEKFPDFRHNKYLRTLNKKQRIIYFFMSRKAFRLVRLMFLIRHMGD